jgi:hypothetical protein
MPYMDMWCVLQSVCGAWDFRLLISLSRSCALIFDVIHAYFTLFHNLNFFMFHHQNHGASLARFLLKGLGLVVLSHIDQSFDQSLDQLLVWHASLTGR